MFVASPFLVADILLTSIHCTCQQGYNQFIWHHSLRLLNCSGFYWLSAVHGSNHTVVGSLKSLDGIAHWLTDNSIDRSPCTSLAILRDRLRDFHGLRRARLDERQTGPFKISARPRGARGGNPWRASHERPSKGCRCLDTIVVLAVPCYSLTESAKSSFRTTAGVTESGCGFQIDLTRFRVCFVPNGMWGGFRFEGWSFSRWARKKLCGDCSRWARGEYCGDCSEGHQVPSRRAEREPQVSSSVRAVPRSRPPEPKGPPPLHEAPQGHRLRLQHHLGFLNQKGRLQRHHQGSELQPPSEKFQAHRPLRAIE